MGDRTLPGARLDLARRIFPPLLRGGAPLPISPGFSPDPEDMADGISQHCSSPEGDWALVGLFNWSGRGDARAVALDLIKSEPKDGQVVHAFEFWSSTPSRGYAPPSHSPHASHTPHLPRCGPLPGLHVSRIHPTPIHTSRTPPTPLLHPSHTLRPPLAHHAVAVVPGSICSKHRHTRERGTSQRAVTPPLHPAPPPLPTACLTPRMQYLWSAQ